MASGASYDDLESWKKADCSANSASLDAVCTKGIFLNSTDAGWKDAKTAIDGQLS